MANSVEVKKSVVKSIVEKEPYDGQYGTLYKFDLVFENGDAGEYSAKVKEQEKFVIGKEVEYEVHINPQYPQYPKIKPHYQQGGGFSGGGGKGFSSEDKQRMARSVAIKSSAIYHQARSTSREDIIADADWMYKYITGVENSYEETPIVAKPIQEKPKNQIPEAKVSMVDASDLPF